MRPDATTRLRVDLRSLRVWHGWLGMLIAPSVIFFSLTGSLQMLNLHESHVGYRAPALLVVAASIHKDQKLPGAPKYDRSNDPAPRYSIQQVALKGFWIGVALALTISTVLGIVIALQSQMRRTTSFVLLILGVLIPLGLLLV